MLAYHHPHGLTDVSALTSGVHNLEHHRLEKASIISLGSYPTCAACAWIDDVKGGGVVELMPSRGGRVKTILLSYCAVHGADGLILVAYE